VNAGPYDDPEFARRYDAEEAPRDCGDVAFYLGLARQAAAAGQPVLELAVGTGRVAVEVARAGIEVSGLDLSPAMLSVARRKAAGLSNLSLVEGDMADFELGRRFGLVYIPFRSFLLLTSVEQQRACLACVRRHLEPGGRFALNFFNPDLPLAQAGSRPRSDAGQRAVSRIYGHLSLRHVSRQEMGQLLRLSGFEVEALYGGFRGEPFDDTSTEMVWVARRPASTQRARAGPVIGGG
jgi:ubiquinone/menaquinone biosynthesis C-methylase UbiE